VSPPSSLSSFNLWSQGYSAAFALPPCSFLILHLSHHHFCLFVCVQGMVTARLSVCVSFYNKSNYMYVTPIHISHTHRHILEGNKKETVVFFTLGLPRPLQKKKVLICFLGGSFILFLFFLKFVRPKFLFFTIFLLPIFQTIYISWLHSVPRVVGWPPRLSFLIWA